MVGVKEAFIVLRKTEEGELWPISPESSRADADLLAYDAIRKGTHREIRVRKYDPGAGWQRGEDVLCLTPDGKDIAIVEMWQRKGGRA